MNNFHPVAYAYESDTICWDTAVELEDGRKAVIQLLGSANPGPEGEGGPPLLINYQVAYRPKMRIQAGLVLRPLSPSPYAQCMTTNRDDLEVVGIVTRLWSGPIAVWLEEVWRRPLPSRDAPQVRNLAAEVEISLPREEDYKT